jgi:hypothetical protein
VAYDRKIPPERTEDSAADSAAGPDAAQHAVTK